MRLKALAFAILCAIECPAQSHMNWQNYCFEHPKAAFCPNREFSGKRTQPNEPEPTSPAVIRSNARVNTPGAARAPVTATNANVIATVRSDINFQFADPAADALAGIHVRRIVDAEITRALISALLSRRGLNQEAVQDLLNRSSSVTEAAISLKDNRVAAAVTGPVVAALPSSSASAKAAITNELGLIGHADAVGRAGDRLAKKEPPSDWSNLAENWQETADFWLVGPPELLGPEAVAAGVRRFSAMVWSRDQLTVDMSFDFSAAPPAELVRKLQFLLNGLEVNGESLHWRVSVNQAELMQNMDKIAATSFGQRLSDLVQAARFLPPAAAAPRAARPVIHGLD